MLCSVMLCFALLCYALFCLKLCAEIYPSFELPMDGLTDLNEVPKDLVFDARSIFYFTGEQVSTSCKKWEMKIEFRFLSDILAKSIFVKARSFDAVTHERFLMMAAIDGGVKINWGRLLFNIFKDMTAESRQARGFAIQISILFRTYQTWSWETPRILSKLGDLELVKGIIAKEKQFLAWAETDSLETAVRRREFTIAKYREMILRKFLESHRQHFQVGQPSTATDLQIIAFLSNAHIFAVETLQTQMRIHGLKWERICSSRLFEGENKDRGSVIARSNTSIMSLCWLRTKTLVDGSWVIQEGNDLWQRLTKQTVPPTIELSPQGQFDDTLAPRYSRSQYSDRYRVDASAFVCVFRRGTDVHMILSESSSSSSRSAHPDATVFASISQRPLDTDLTSPNPSTTDSHVFFTTDDTPMGVDQILMPTAVTPQDFTKQLAQLRALVSQISTDLYGGLFNNMRQEIQIQKSALSLDILASQRKLITQQAALATGLDDIRKDVDETKAALSNALLEFHAQAQEIIITFPLS
ncbi:hypothetical protein F511_35832 [Dorcoceras hygrometricum]|uniref:Uncharacterized protein n=1 Tax=Dorcoceras hygrometricum TaxID=472368 RepID=A0A2Z7BMC0_9LAMI|nr:hypothetical protein F511_35832 [Dorcoceras hygrometricum]